MTKYIAKQSLGHFRPGDEIKGLNDDRIQALLASGAIEECKPPEQHKADDVSAGLVGLEAEVAELKANEKILTAEKDSAEAEVAELKVKVVALEKALAASEKKTAAEAKKPAAETK